MAANDPIGSESRSELADWVEISSIVAAGGSTGSAELRRLLAREEPLGEHQLLIDPHTGEALEEETLESAANAVEEAVVQELQFRRDLLDDSYPFELLTAGHSWRLRHRTAEGPGRATYLSCLFVSGMRDGRLNEGALRAATGVDPARLFQEFATLAATEFLGRGISFGWPRPDGTNFRDALASFTVQLGVGIARTNPPPASGRKEKDEGIDVIAWRSFRDRRPGHLILLGQVASGGNWRGKPVSSEVGTFLDWFNVRPTNRPVEAMFIPFPQYHDWEPVCEVSWDEGVVDLCRQNEITYGLMFDRLRLTEFTQQSPEPEQALQWLAGAVNVAECESA